MFLRKDQNNDLYYFPYGKFTTGRKLTSTEETTKVKNSLQSQQILLISSIAIPFSMKGLNFSGVSGVIALSITSIFVYLIFSFLISRKLTKTSITWNQTSEFKEPVKPVTLKGLLFASASSLLFVLVGIYMALSKSNHSPILALVIIIFFSVILLTLIKKIVTKEYKSSFKSETL